MQITGMLIFLFAWLLIWWIGPIALEASGLERGKARFQALSALSGTGFTTREAESIVNHPKRRRIATWLIFMGSIGIVAFFLVLVLYVRAGFQAPSIPHIIFIIVSILLLTGIILAGIPGKVTNRIIKSVQKPSGYITEEIVYQSNGYEIARLKIKETNTTDTLKVSSPVFKERNITIMAIERGARIVSLPKDEEPLLAGDYVLCYGKETDISELEQ